MGVIQRQGIKQSIVILISVIIGTINTIIIYPAVLSTEELGLIRFLLDTSSFVVPFILLGTSAVIIRFYPHFKNKHNNNNGFLFLSFILPFLGFITFLFICFFSKTYIYNFYDEKKLINDYLIYIPILSFLLVILYIITSHINNQKRIVVPTIFNKLFLKLGLPTLSILYYFSIITLNMIMIGIIITLTISIIFSFFYLNFLEPINFRPNLKFLDKKLVREILVYSSYSLLGSLGSIFALRIDTIMVSSLINLDNTGIYSICMFIANVVGIPTAAILSISNPIISQDIKDKKFKKIENLYSKSSLNLFIIGCLLLLGIWASIDNLFDLMPNGETFRKGKYVVLILGLAKIMDMVTSINGQIISYSKFFRYNFIFILILAIFNIILNLLFIPIFQINGVALATMSSLILYNLLKTGFVYYKIGIHPFTANTFKILVTTLIVYGIILIIPLSNSPFFNIIIKSVVITILYGSTVLYFNFSPDITNLFLQSIKRLKSNFFNKEN